MRTSVQTKLTLWYVLLFGALLLGFSLCLYALIARSFRERLDVSLANTALTAAKLFHGELAENGRDPQIAVAHFFTEFKPPPLYLALLQTSAAASSSAPPQLLATNFDRGTPPAIAAGVTPALPAAAAFDEARRLPAATPLLLDARWFGPAGGRLAVYPFSAEGQDFFVLVAESRAVNAALLASLRKIFFLSLPVLLLVAGLAGFFFAHKALAPVAAMTTNAALISAQNLHQRLPVGNTHDELGKLARVFNQLLDRLEAAFERMRTFTADASHELRTPLAIIRGEAEIALAQERAPAEYRETLNIIQDEAGRVVSLVEDLLSLARADAGQQPLQHEALYFNDLVDESCRAVKVLAQSRRVALQVAPAEDIPLQGDPKLLRRMVLNLLDNALKYTPPGGSVRVELNRNCTHAELKISDTGIGIPAEAAPHVFERFYRVDKARSRAAGGSGLGLPIVKWIAEAHGGGISLTSRPGAGSTFCVRLPLE
jgi:heavy metal sensor kinase